MNVDTAVINIGSNSVKLFVPTDNALGYKRIITSRLAAGATLEGKMLDPASAERTFLALKELKDEARQRGIATLYVYATEALRRAENKDILLRPARDELGLDIDIISGETEAEIAALGASLSFPRHTAFADIGGASTEVAFKENGGFLCASFPVGAVRLSESACDPEALEERAAEALKPAKCADHIVGLGGTFSSLACISLGLKRYDAGSVHGCVLGIGKLERINDELAPLSPEEIVSRFPAVTLARAEVIKAGLAIARALGRAMNAADFTVSLGDGLKGYLLLKDREKQNK